MEQTKRVLEDALHAKGFEVTQHLQVDNSTCGPLFLVREAAAGPDGGPTFVAKTVSLMGLDAQSRAAALQEVSVLRGLEKHPNLVAYRESFQEETVGVLLIVMSYAEDGDLRRAVAESQTARRSIPEAIVLSWFRQILEGLRHLHSQAVVHRDLKSSNIFLCEGRRLVRIGDFGISKILESTAFAISCVGTPAYMSPELMRNERYAFHVDMWALGIVCFELCTLRLPFLSRSLLGLVNEVVGSEPDWSLWSHSEELRDGVSRLLLKDAELRPTAADMLGEALFAEGGRGACEPPEDAWRQWLPGAEAAEAEGGPKMSRLPLSQVTTADDVPAGLSTTWTSTPRMPWESETSRDPSRQRATPSGTVPASDGAFARELQAARQENREFSRVEFEGFLTAHRRLLQAELGGQGAGEDAAGPLDFREPEPQVAESLI